MPTAKHTRGKDRNITLHILTDSNREKIFFVRHMLLVVDQKRRWYHSCRRRSHMLPPSVLVRKSETHARYGLISLRKTNMMFTAAHGRSAWNFLVVIRSATTAQLYSFLPLSVAASSDGVSSNHNKGGEVPLPQSWRRRRAEPRYQSFLARHSTWLLRRPDRLRSWEEEEEQLIASKLQPRCRRSVYPLSLPRTTTTMFESRSSSSQSSVGVQRAIKATLGGIHTLTILVTDPFEYSSM